MTKRLLIDGKKVSSEADFHQLVAETFCLPPWYGRNLDAFRDALTGLIEWPVEIIWVASDVSKEKLSCFNEIVSIIQEAQDLASLSGREGDFIFRLE